MKNEMYKKAVTTKKFWVVSAVSLIFAAGIVLYIIISTIRHERENIEDELIYDLKLPVQFLNLQIMGRQLQAMRGLSSFPVIPQVCKEEKPSDDPYCLAILEGVRTASGASIVYVMNCEGTVVASTRYSGNAITGNNYKFRPYFKQAITGKNYVYIALGVTTGKRGMYFSVPVIDINTSKPCGVAVMKIDLTSVDHVLESIDYPCVLMSEDGIIISANRNGLLYGAALPMSEKKREEIIASKQFADKPLKNLPFNLNKDTINWQGTSCIVKSMELDVQGWKIVEWRPIVYSYLLRTFVTTAGIILLAIILPYYIIGKIQISNERKQAALAVKRAHDNLKKILENAPFGVVIIGKDKIIRWANETVLKLTGIETHEEIHGKKCSEYLCPYDGNQCPVLDQNKEIRGSEKILRRKDGSEMPVLKSVNKIMYEDEEVLLETFVDITEYKKMEGELARARNLESIGHLAGGIAHEINNPTQFVTANICFLQDVVNDIFGLLSKLQELIDATKNGNVNPEMITEMEKKLKDADIEYLGEEIPGAIEQSLEGIKRITKIVLAMKEFAKPDGATHQNVNINEAIETTVTVAYNEWKYASELTTKLDPSLPLIQCAAGEIKQTILSLLENAVHAIENRNEEGKGEIKIVTTHDERWAIIEISDTGIGIPEDIQDKIFDPFFSTKEVGRGMGQDLSALWNIIVNKHKGELSFKSQKGEGTTFIVKIPIKQNEN